MRFSVIRFSVLFAVLFLASSAYAGDPCAGRNPAYCQPAPGPIIVESVRVKPRGSITTTHDTIVSQDGRILLVIKGDDHTSSPSKVRRRRNYGR